MRADPTAIKSVAVKSYLHTNFSLRSFIDNTMLNTIANAHVVVNRETSANGSVTACPILAMIIGITPSSKYCRVQQPRLKSLLPSSLFLSSAF